MGHTVNFRTFKKHYKDKRTRSDPKDWLIFENTHDPIVDAETWHLAQKLRKTVRRTDTIGEANPLTGLMYCADCGAKMYNHRSKQGNSWNDYYNCSVYTRSAHREKRACCSRSISTKAIRALLLATIRTVSAYAIENEAEFIRKVRAASQVQKEDHAKALKRKITKEKRRCTELDTLIKKLYESYATGKIPEKRFEMLSSEYEQEQTALEESIAAEQAELEQFAQDSDRVEQFLALAKSYQDFTELTTPMIHEFVEKILVHAPEKIDGERSVQVDIYLRFIGNFPVPIPEPTPEELARQEAERKKRAANRRKYYQRKEKLRQAEQQRSLEKQAI